MTDHFRPRNDPARAIYDAFQKEAEYRDGRSAEEWQEAERMAVWRTARDYAEAHGMTTPTMDDVKRAETSACGHIDYGSKWAFGVVDAMRRPAVA